MSPEKKKDPSFFDLYLSKFQTNNPHCSLQIESNNLIIDSPWGSNDIRIIVDLKDQDLISDLNNIILDPRFDAIIHLDTNTIEFIYAYLDPDEEDVRGYLDRKFLFHYLGSEFNCEFCVPTQRMYNIAKCVHRLHSDYSHRTVTQIIVFKDSQKLEKLSDRGKKYFEKKVPRNFFISTESSLNNIDLEQLFRHVNFISRYYDRRTPYIAIREGESEKESKLIKPTRYIESEFPASIVLNPINDIILRLIDVAIFSSPRFAFLYYYKVFEYAGYYYINAQAKRSLQVFLKDPSVINCTEEKLSSLFSILSTLNQNDDSKIKKVIEECCDPIKLWCDINNNIKFFSQTIEFDGGFILNELVPADINQSAWCSMWMPKIFDYFSKIRNCLVHARERREDRVILPTKTNNQKILQFLPIIHRMAEFIAIKSEN